MAEQRFTVRVHDEGVGTLWAEVLELPGCYATGDTEEELLEAVVEAVGLCLDARVDEARWGERQDLVEDRQVLIST